MAAHAIDWLYQEYLTIDSDTKVIGKCFLNVYRKAEIPMCSCNYNLREKIEPKSYRTILGPIVCYF